MFTKNDLVLVSLAALLVMGLAVYFSGNLKLGVKQAQDPEISQILSQGTSDDLDSIERDLEATNLDNIDQEVLGIQTELSE